MKELFSPEFWFAIGQTFSKWSLDKLPNLLVILLLFILSLWLFSRVIRKADKLMLKGLKMSLGEESQAEQEKRVNTLIHILAQAGKIVIWMVFMLIFLKEIGVNIGPILASAGIVGLAVGFGAQELVRDFISGFFMLMENQVREGDVAVINGTGGLVESIALRTITLRDFSGTVHVFQNGKINSLSNMTKEWSAAVFDIGVAYKEDTTEVSAVIQEVGDQMMSDEEFREVIQQPIELFGVDKLADSSVVIRARLKTKPGEQWRVMRAFNARLKKAFDKKGIEIPFPHQTIYWGEAIDPLKVTTDIPKKP